MSAHKAAKAAKKALFKAVDEAWHEGADYAERAAASIHRREAAHQAEEFEHGYASGFDAGRQDIDKKLRDLIADIALAAAFTGKDVAELPEYVEQLRRRAAPEAGAETPEQRLARAYKQSRESS